MGWDRKRGEGAMRYLLLAALVAVGICGVVGEAGAEDEKALTSKDKAKLGAKMSAAFACSTYAELAGKKS